MTQDEMVGHTGPRNWRRRAQAVFRDWATTHGLALDPFLASDLVERIEKALYVETSRPPEAEKEIARLKKALGGVIEVWDRWYQKLPRDAEDDEFGALLRARAALSNAGEAGE